MVTTSLMKILNIFEIWKFCENFQFLFLILEFWNFLKILKFFENFEILWNFMKTRIFEFFWKFWNLMKILKCYENFESLINFRNFEMFWNFWNFEIFLENSEFSLIDDEVRVFRINIKLSSNPAAELEIRSETTFRG